MEIEKMYESVKSLFQQKNDICSELKEQRTQLVVLAKDLKKKQKRCKDKKELEDLKKKRKVVKKMIEKIKKSMKNESNITV